MARVKITEYRAKKLLLGDQYRGIAIDGTKARLPKSGRFVVKVDQGVKKRFKQGLVAVNVSPKEISGITAGWKKKGFTRFLAEPLVPHEPHEERYLSLERVRGGIRLLAAAEGGINVEDQPKKVAMHLISDISDISLISEKADLPEKLLADLLQAFEKYYFAFLEINPLVVQGNTVHLLDAAALVDSAGVFFVNGAWSEDDIVEAKSRHPAETAVRELQKTTPASLKLTVVNPDGGLFFLLSGGGGSIVIADEAALRGAEKEIGNYGEYSGNPTREETYLYTRQVLSLLLASRAKKKALVIAGGVANFTDIKATFAGIIDALKESAGALRKAGVKVFIRRGGPNEAAGLAHMGAFLKEEGLFGALRGSDAPITSAVDAAVDSIRK